MLVTLTYTNAFERRKNQVTVMGGMFRVTVKKPAQDTEITGGCGVTVDRGVTAQL